jgi:hypothetical protein
MRVFCALKKYLPGRRQNPVGFDRMGYILQFICKSGTIAAVATKMQDHEMCSDFNFLMINIGARRSLTQ